MKNKNLLKLKNVVFFFKGEYVAPERIENIYIQSKYIAQVFVYGNGYKVIELI
jgi:long-chain acyl-CoA synthetase